MRYLLRDSRAADHATSPRSAALPSGLSRPCQQVSFPRTGLRGTASDPVLPPRPRATFAFPGPGWPSTDSVHSLRFPSLAVIIRAVHIWRNATFLKRNRRLGIAARSL